MAAGGAGCRRRFIAVVGLPVQSGGLWHEYILLFKKKSASLFFKQTNIFIMMPSVIPCYWQPHRQPWLQLEEVNGESLWRKATRST